MSFLDRLRARGKPPVDQPPRGESGRGQYQSQGIVVPDDHKWELTGRTGAMEFDRMWRSDPDARKAVLMVVNALAGATLNIEPAGGEDATDEDREVAEFVKWALFEHLQPRLTSHIYTALTVCLRNGRAPFEKTWTLTRYDGRDVFALKSLGLRRPASITRWMQDKHGQLTAIEQIAGGRILTMDAADLVLYRLGDEGDNWEGQSILRPAYKPFTYIEQLELIDAMGHERFALGVPICYPPQGATPDQLDEVEETLRDLRAGESSYIVAPGPNQQYLKESGSDQGWLFEILTPDTTGTKSVQESITMHRQRMAAAVVEEFMRLGQDQVGARATADVQQDPFLAYCEALCGLLIEDPINTQVIPELVALNFEVDECPKLSASLIDSTSLTELASFVSSLSGAGALHADDPLEDHLRDLADLPPADPQAREERKAQAEVQAQREQEAHEAQLEPGGQQDESQERTMTLRADRPLKAWEQMMQLDRVESTLDTARDRMLAAIAPAAHDLAARLAAMRTPRAPKTPDQGLLDAVSGELRRLYDEGAQSVRDELLAQTGAMLFRLDDASPAEDAAELAARSEIAVENITARMLIDLRRANLAPLARSATDQAALQAAAEAGARAAAREAALDNASAALNLGRRASAEANRARIKGARYTSILDASRCSSCAAADDDILRPLDDPVRLARIPPNPACSGGQRCRCLEFYSLTDQAPGYAGAG